MKKFLLSLTLLLSVVCLGSSRALALALAQEEEVAAPVSLYPYTRWGVEIGGFNGVTLEHALSQRFSLRTSVGLSLNAGVSTGYGFYYRGLTPSAGVGARFFYQRNPQLMGGFLALDLEGYWNKMTFLVSRRYIDDKLHATFRLTPTWGYRFPMGESWSGVSYLGVGLDYALMDVDNCVRLVRGKSTAINFGFVLEYRF